MTISDIEKNQGGFGRLKPVTKVRKPFTCRECKKEFPIGSPCYVQSDYSGEGFFPVQTRICLDCGKIQIDQGVEIKTKKKKEKVSRLSNEGCGKDTEYPKPNKKEMWKCGENTMVGKLFCRECRK